MWPRLEAFFDWLERWAAAMRERCYTAPPFVNDGLVTPPFKMLWPYLSGPRTHRESLTKDPKDS